MIQTVFCDESGFTGPYLSDKDQPYFVYTSLAISPDKAAEVLQTAINDFNLQGSEMKGTKLVKSKKGAAVVSYVLQECAQQSQSVVINKKYALACKLFEYIFEPALSEKIGIFYALGFQKFVSTLLFAELIIKTTSAENLLDRFERLMRTRGAEGITEFFGETVTKRRTQTIAKEVAAFAHGQRAAIVEELETIESLGGVARWTLDLTISALNSLLCHWGEKFGQLDVCCDESKPLQDYLSDEHNIFGPIVGRTDKQYLEIGGQKRPVTFNLARPISLAISKDNPGLQIADVIAASLSYAMKNQQDQTGKSWFRVLVDRSALHSESILPQASDANASTPVGALNRFIFMELVKRSRKGIDLLEGIEDFIRFPYADMIRESMRKASRNSRRM